MAELRKYGVGTTVEFPIQKRGAADFAVGADWTPAAGDVKISKDGGAAANVTNLPTAKAMGNTALWVITLTATEMQAAQIFITIADAATKVVEDDGVVVETYGDPNAMHAFDLDTASVAQTGDAYGVVNTRLPAALVSGRMDASVGAVANGVIAAASFAGNALDAVWSTTTRTLSAFSFSVTVGTNNDKTGYALSSAGVQAVWDALTSALTAVGSIGKLLVDNINATISSRLPTASYTAPLDAAGTRSAVGLGAANLDTQLSGISAKTVNLPLDPADASDVAAAFAATDAAIAVVDGNVDAIKAKTDQIAFTSAGKVDSNPLAINGDTTAAANLAKTTGATVRGTVAAGGTTTSIPTSAMSPAGAAADQFKGKIVTFDRDTATPALRGQSTDITASTNAATPTLTVTALTTPPAAGDTFSIT